MTTERFGDRLAFAEPKQAIVDEDADKLLADARARSAAVTEESTPPDTPQITRSCGPTRRRISATVCSSIRLHCPGAFAPGDAVEKVAEDRCALRSVTDFRMELQSVHWRLVCLTAAIGHVEVDANGAKSPSLRTWSP